MAKVLPFKGGVLVEETPLGLTHHKVHYSKAAKFWDWFRIYRSIRFENKPLLYKRSDFLIKEGKNFDFFHHCWEFELIDPLFHNYMRPFSNEELGYLIYKYKRIRKDIGDIEKFMNEKIGDKNNSKAKKTLGDFNVFSMQESRKELIQTKKLLTLLVLEAEKDLKKKKKVGLPNESLPLVYPVQLLKKIHNYLNTKQDSTKFIYQELVRLPSLEDLKSINIEIAIKKSKEKAFQDQYLRSINNEEDFSKAVKFILG